MRGQSSAWKRFALSSRRTAMSQGRRCSQRVSDTSAIPRRTAAWLGFGVEASATMRSAVFSRSANDATRSRTPCRAWRGSREARGAERCGGLVQGFLEQAVRLRGPRGERGDLERTRDQISDAVVPVETDEDDREGGGILHGLAEPVKVRRQAARAE